MSSHFQVVQKGGENVVRSDGTSDISKGVDRGAPDGLLVRFEQLEQLEADAHPFASRNHLGAALCNATHQLDAVLLHLLVPNIRV